MPAGNYDEGIERISLTGAADHVDQRQLRERQAERMRSKVIGTVVAILFAVAFFVSYWFQSLEGREVAKKILEVSMLIEAGKYEKALVAADEVVNSGHYQWYGHLYKAVAFIYLERFKEAEIEADKLASYFSGGVPLPRQFHKTYIYAKLLNNNVDVDSVLTLGSNYRPYLKRLLLEVLHRQDICYPLFAKSDLGDVYGAPEIFGCFPERSN